MEIANLVLAIRLFEHRGWNLYQGMRHCGQRGEVLLGHANEFSMAVIFATRLSSWYTLALYRMRVLAEE